MRLRDIILENTDSDIEVDRFQDIILKLKSLGWSQDQPSHTTKWLKHQREDAANGRIGSTTAYIGMRKEISLCLKTLSMVEGMRGEEAWRDQDERFQDIVNNFDPEKIGMIFIQVDYSGKPWINEGNHRMAACHHLGFKYIPGYIQYHAGGECVEGALNPRTALKNKRVIKRPNTIGLL